MRFQLASDIHTEMYRDPLQPLQAIPVIAPTLVVAGDLGTLKTLPVVLPELCSRWEHVVMVAGNHEHYGASFQEVATLRASLGIPNLHWLHNSATEIEGQRFVGTTLWFRDDPMNFHYSNQMNDFHVIRGFRREVGGENQRAVNFLRATIQPGDVVVTHHLPSDRSVAPRYRNDPLNRFYVCSLDATIEKTRPRIWCHGHSHIATRYQAGVTEVVSNPHGYPDWDDGSTFNPTLVLTVP